MTAVRVRLFLLDLERFYPYCFKKKNSGNDIKVFTKLTIMTTDMRQNSGKHNYNIYRDLILISKPVDGTTTFKNSQSIKSYRKVLNYIRYSCR